MADQYVIKLMVSQSLIDNAVVEEGGEDRVRGLLRSDLDRVLSRAFAKAREAAA